MPEVSSSVITSASYLLPCNHLGTADSRKMLLKGGKERMTAATMRIKPNCQRDIVNPESYNPLFSQDANGKSGSTDTASVSEDTQLQPTVAITCQEVQGR